MATFRKDLVDEENRTPEEKLLYLSREPAACPISACQTMTFASNVLSHYYASHGFARHQQITEVYDSQKVMINAAIQNSILGENICLKMLLYGGYDGKPETLPARRFLSLKNDIRFAMLNKHAEYLPIYIMMCHTSYTSMMQMNISEEDRCELNKKDHIYVIWAASTNRLLNLYVTISVFDDVCSKSFTGTRRVRILNEPQKVNEFFPSDSNFLLLNQSEVDALMEPPNTKKTVKLEIILHEGPMSTSLSSESAAVTAALLSDVWSALPSLPSSTGYKH